MAESSSTAAALAAPGKQIKLQLSTKQANYALPENIGPILIETNLRRYGLSVLVNHLLGQKDQLSRIPFDFLINGTILRTSIEEYLKKNGISSETVLHAEYVPAFVPPKHVASFEHDAWVSSIDVLPSGQANYGQPLILSGSYDGLAQIWNTSSQRVAQSPYLGDSEGKTFIKAVKFVSPTRFVTGGFERFTGAIRLLQFDGAESVSDTATIKHEADLLHHTAPVAALDADNQNQRLLSASADKTIALWNTDIVPPAQSTSGARRRRIEVELNRVTPMSVFQGHTHHVTGVLFSPHTPDQAYSISADTTLKAWSLTGTILDNRPLADPLYSITNITNMHLIAVGSSKGDISLIDPRSSHEIKVSTVRQAHLNGFVSSLASDPSSQYRFASGGYDGILKIWDIRSLNSAPIAINRGDKSKIFAVRWDADIGILSAGEDRKVRIDK